MESVIRESRTALYTTRTSFAYTLIFIKHWSTQDYTIYYKATPKYISILGGCTLVVCTSVVLTDFRCLLAHGANSFSPRSSYKVLQEILFDFQKYSSVYGWQQRSCLRIRPLIENEKGYQMCLDVIPGKPQVHVHNIDKSFTYKYGFPLDIGYKRISIIQRL